MADTKNVFTVGCFLLILVGLLSSCSVIKKKNTDSAEPQLAGMLTQKPLPPEENQKMMKDVAGNWFYGHNLKNNILQINTIIVFPPYAILALGNVVLNVSGYESIGVGSVLSEENKEKWNSVYDSFTAGPGRFTSAVAGKEFITRDMAGEKIKRYIMRTNPAEASLDIPSNEQWQIE